MAHCYICDISDVTIPNSKVTYKGKKNGKRVRKTVHICQTCGAFMSNADILERIRNNFGWDDEEE